MMWANILLIPGWISAVSRASWSVEAKKFVIVLMVITSSAITITVIVRGNPDRTTEIIGAAVWTLYLLLVILSAKYYWPR
jgi:Ca2+/Na+ antiporter